MKLLDFIQLRNSGPICQDCAYFQNDPALVEEAYAGLRTMSSGYASVRDRDGFCIYNQLYLSARDSCACFTLSEQVLQSSIIQDSPNGSESQSHS
jgi:hypothetical protein